mgnify:CR=1 FL=1
MRTKKVTTPKLVFVIGINNAYYVTQKKETIRYVNGKRKQKQVWICPFYRTWTSMLQRCYYNKLQERCPTYRGYSVSEDWLTFSNFRAWMEKQDWQGNQLDKDLLFDSNKIYSADTCVFVSHAVNSFTTDRGNDRGELKIGVSWHKRESKFRSSCRNPFTKKVEHLGYFDSEHLAHNAWAKRKLELAYELAAIQTDSRVAESLINRYSKYKHNRQNGCYQRTKDLNFD